MIRRVAACVASVVVLMAPVQVRPQATPRPVSALADRRDETLRLVGALAGDTPLLGDLESLTDRIGGRATGSSANERAVQWALARFRDAGVNARAESFTMPVRWLERSVKATVRGDGVEFSPAVAAMPFSAPTPANGTTAPLLDAGYGKKEDFARLGSAVRGAFLLVQQDELRDVDGLFREYGESAEIEQRAFAAGVAGVVYMGSRPYNTLYRHNVSIGASNVRPMVVMEHDAAEKALRIVRGGTSLTLTERIDIDGGGPYQALASKKPQKRSPSTRAKKSTKQVRAPRGTVLVVDDVPDVTEMIELLLKHAGYDVATAGSAKAALQMARKQHFDLVISDIGMPEMNGYELASALRDLASYNSTPLIAVTGYSEYDDRGRAVRAGFNVHLAKPIEPTQLLSLMNELLSQTEPGTNH